MNEFFISPIGKSLAGLVFIVVLLVIGNNLYQTQLSKTQKSVNTTVTYERKPAQTVLATINISGFDCPTCPISAEYALKDTKGIFDAKITSSGEGSRILYDANTITVENFKQVLTPFTIEVVSQETSSESKLN